MKTATNSVPRKKQALSLRSNIPLCIGLAVAFVIVVFASYFNPYYVNAETKRKARLYDQLLLNRSPCISADRRVDNVDVGEIIERERAFAKCWLIAYL